MCRSSSPLAGLASFALSLNKPKSVLIFLYPLYIAWFIAILGHFLFPAVPLKNAALKVDTHCICRNRPPAGSLHPALDQTVPGIARHFSPIFQQEKGQGNPSPAKFQTRMFRSKPFITFVFLCSLFSSYRL